MENAISYFNVLPETKQQIKDFASQVKCAVLNGNVDVLKFAVQLKAIEDTMKRLRADKDISDLICEEAEKYSELRKGGIDYSGANLTIRMVGVKYEYNDSKLDDLTIELDRLKGQIKDRETLLKAIKEPIADAETGEMLNPAIKSGSEKIIVKL